jgi:hypothetical protein
MAAVHFFRLFAFPKEAPPEPVNLFDEPFLGWENRKMVDWL